MRSEEGEVVISEKGGMRREELLISEKGDPINL